MGSNLVDFFFFFFFFAGRVIPMTYTLVLEWLSCQPPGVIGSALGQVGRVSQYRDRVKITIFGPLCFRVKVLYSALCISGENNDIRPFVFQGESTIFGPLCFMAKVLYSILCVL